MILSVSGYVRRHRFYRTGVYQHLALLVASPLLAVVFVLLIQLVKIDAEAVRLDLSDPRILAAIAFLLASTPWKLWERLQTFGADVLSNKDAAAGRAG